MATNLPSCFLVQFLEQLLKFLVNFTLLKYVKSQRSYGFLITKELILGFQILDLKDHFLASCKVFSFYHYHSLPCSLLTIQRQYKIAVIFSLSLLLWEALGENCVVSVQRDCNLAKIAMERILRWGSLQLCQSLVNRL